MYLNYDEKPQEVKFLLPLRVRQSMSKEVNYGAPKQADGAYPLMYGDITQMQKTVRVELVQRPDGLYEKKEMVEEKYPDCAYGIKYLYSPELINKIADRIVRFNTLYSKPHCGSLLHKIIETKTMLDNLVKHFEEYFGKIDINSLPTEWCEECYEIIKEYETSEN